MSKHCNYKNMRPTAQVHPRKSEINGYHFFRSKTSRRKPKFGRVKRKPKFNGAFIYDISPFMNSTR